MVEYSDIKKYKRIYVTGAPGVGKTTFAERLSESLGIPYFRLDDLAHSSDFSKRFSDTEKKEGLEKLLKKSSWIIEGVHDTWMEPLYQSAELVLNLDPPKLLSLYRVYKRSRDLIKQGTTHTYKDMAYLLKKALKYDSEKRPETLSRIESYGLPSISLRRKKEVDNLLDYLNEGIKS